MIKVPALKIIEVLSDNFRHVTTRIKKQIDIEMITLMSLKDTEINSNFQVIVAYAELRCFSETVMLDTLTSIIRLYIRVREFSNVKDIIEKANVLKSQTKAKALRKEIIRSTGPKDIAH